MSHSGFNAAQWLVGAEPALLEEISKQYEKATNHVDFFQCRGLCFDKDNILAHYGNKLNLVTKGIKTLKQFRELQKQDSEAEPIGLFYFSELSEHREQDGDDSQDPEWTTELGKYVTINEPKINEKVEEIEDLIVARVVEIVYTVSGKRLIGVNWMYRITDTDLAEAVKKEGEKKVPKEELDERLKVLPVDTKVFDRRLWLCGSAADNARYCTYYPVGKINEPAEVKFVAPGINTLQQVLELHPDFDVEQDYYYNGFTQKDFWTFEDLHQDFTTWSPLYRQVWETYGVEGIKKLRGKLTLGDIDGGFKKMMSLCWGAPNLNFKLDYKAAGAGSSVVAAAARAQEVLRILYKMEFFAGGGGLSHMAQELEHLGRVVSAWANDINPSACATYAANKPDTFVSCCGLEELQQLHRKFAAVCDKYLGPGWKQLPQLQDLLLLPPGKRYSRQHMPQGVGCSGGQNPDDCLPFVYSAKEGQEARKNMEGLLLSLVGKSVGQVRQVLVQQQPAADKTPVTQQVAEAALKQAHHLQEYNRLRAAAEAALPQPDFDECYEALPEVQLLPSGFDSSSGSIKERAARLLGVVLPRAAPKALLAAAAASAHIQQGSKSKKQKKGEQERPKTKMELAQELKQLQEQQKQAVLQAYDQAWDHQLEVVEENLTLQEERGLGEVLEVRDVRIRDCAVRVKQGSSSKQMQGALTSYECWLEFEVQREGSTEWVWEHEALMLLDDAIPAAQHFLLRMVADKTVPLPGDIQLMTGGPPCQNMSGLNRHTRQEDVMTDPKNRLVASYMGMIEHHAPPYLLIEQVTDILKKEDGKYARFSMITMLQHGYQGRVGVMTAGFYGAAQGRVRVIILGALSGTEQLPPFPAATHKCKAFQLGNPSIAPHCVVGALPAGTKVGELVAPKLMPFNVWGDVGSDLPVVDNFSETERLEYASAPKTYLQQWLRREPPKHELPLLMRAAHADAAMALWGPSFDKEQVDSALAGNDPAAVMAAGMLALCQTCKWLGGNTTEDVRKLAEDFGRLSKAPTGDGDKEGDSSDDEDDKGQEEGGELQDGDDDEAAKELRGLMAAERDFTRKVQRRHLAAGGDPDIAEEILLMAQTQQHAITQMTGVRRMLEMKKAYRTEGVLGTLRDQRPHQCNLDDLLRMEALPQGETLGVCYRDLPGVVTNPDRTSCNGCWHAAAVPATEEDEQLLKERVAAWNKKTKEEKALIKDPVKWVHKGVNLKSGCAGGGSDPKPPTGLFKSGNDTKHRVDSYGASAVGSTTLKGCKSRTLFMASNGLLCPRWCVTYKAKTGSIGRHGCFGILHNDAIQPTVVTRPEPHNLEVVVDGQGRVISVRENARCQAFPDFHVFVGLGVGNKYGSGKGVRTVSERYLQIGNAVAPPMAAALGRCLLLAAAKKAPVAEPVIPSPDPDWEAAVKEGKRSDCIWYSQEHGVSQAYPDYWQRHPNVSKVGGKRKQQAGADEGDADGAADDDSTAAAGVAAAPKRKKSKGSGSSASALQQQAAASAAAAAAAAAGGDDSYEAAAAGCFSNASSKAKAAKKRSASAAAAAAAAGVGDEEAAEAGPSAQRAARAARKHKRTTQQDAGAAAADADAGEDAAGADDAAAAAAGSPQRKHKKRAKQQQQAQAVAPAPAAAAAPPAAADLEAPEAAEVEAPPEAAEAAVPPAAPAAAAPPAAPAAPVAASESDYETADTAVISNDQAAYLSPIGAARAAAAAVAAAEAEVTSKGSRPVRSSAAATAAAVSE